MVDLGKLGWPVVRLRLTSGIALDTLSHPPASSTKESLKMKSMPAALLATLLLGLALTIPQTAAAAESKVTVFGQENEVRAIFKTAKCTKGKKRGGKVSFYIDSVSTNGSYELTATIFQSFTGFHQYDLTLDPNPTAYLRFSEKGEYQSGGYSNEFVPSFPVPGFGAIKFSPDGKRVGLGFGPAMWNRDASDAVVLAGAVECRYPKKKKG
jgi:hypothetical protein